MAALTPDCVLDVPETRGVASLNDTGLQIIMSFDVEEHYRIEAAAGVSCDPGTKQHYADRMARTTFWLLEELDRLEILSTFFIVGEIAKTDPGLVRAIHRAGHEVASHGWDHRRVHAMAPSDFREDIRRSKEALEDVTGEAVVGYRAPTFSITRQTSWALDVLVEQGMRYDSSVFPVRHDRYGVPDAPRAPFVARGWEHSILELPPATRRVGTHNLPVGGGGYFRLFPLAVMERAFQQLEQTCSPAVATLYFHPWEFDPGQPRLPLRGLNRFRTYVGIERSRQRLATLLARHRFVRAIDLVDQLEPRLETLATFGMARA
jgi:polysaccharide deacetylase family protein (PEP-CTERM system associated)